jgi:hypothetical protein
MQPPFRPPTFNHTLPPAFYRISFDSRRWRR